MYQPAPNTVLSALPGLGQSENMHTYEKTECGNSNKCGDNPIAADWPAKRERKFANTMSRLPHGANSRAAPENLKKYFIAEHRSNAHMTL